MAFPVNGDTADLKMVYHEKMEQQVYRLLNNTGSAVTQGDYILIHGFFGIVLQTVADGLYFGLRVDDEIEIQANDLNTSANTFGTLYQTVYYNPTDKEFADDPAYGYPVGKLSKIKDSDGAIVFFNLTKMMPLAGSVQTVEFVIGADASAGLTFDPGFDYEVLDMVVYSQATVVAETLTVGDGTNDITNAIDIDTVDTRAVPATIDETYKEISGTDVLTFTALTSAGRARVLLTIKAV